MLFKIPACGSNEKVWSEDPARPNTGVRKNGSREFAYQQKTINAKPSEPKRAADKTEYPIPNTPHFPN